MPLHLLALGVALFVSEDDKIKSIGFNDYVSFARGVKAANNELFKAFYNDAQMEQNC